MADQITEPTRIARRYCKSTCWFWSILGIVCIGLCIWITLANSLYQFPHPAPQTILSPTPSPNTLSYKHLYSVHQPAHLTIHIGNTPSPSPVRDSSPLPRSFLYLPLPAHPQSSTPTPHPIQTQKSLRKILPTPLATTSPALSFSSIPTPTPIVSLPLLPQQSTSTPLPSITPAPTLTPLPTLAIQATPIQGRATPQPIPTKTSALQLPEPGTPVSAP